MSRQMFQISREPVRFGPADRQMVGMYHFPKPVAPQGIAALLCNPFGQEAIRAQRIFTVLADRLARHGVPVLRFDYHGTGDSPGECTLGEMTGWASDILAAQRKLDDLAQPVTRVWISLRLGALLAAAASVATPASAHVDSLVLWEPVVDGKAYLQELARADRDGRLGAYSMDSRKYARLASEPLPAVPDEVLGFPLPAALRDQLLAAEGQAFSQARCARITYITSRSGDADVLGRLRPVEMAEDAISIHRVNTVIDWATTDAGGSTIAPNEIVNLIIPIVLGGVR